MLHYCYLCQANGLNSRDTGNVFFDVYQFACVCPQRTDNANSSKTAKATDLFSERDSPYLTHEKFFEKGQGHMTA